MLYALLATCFTFTDIPVFWPILVMYFIVLVFVTMKKQIKVRLVSLQYEKISQANVSLIFIGLFVWLTVSVAA